MDKSYTSNTFLFSFEGRISRARYWYAVVASVTSCAVFLALLALALGAILGISVTSIKLDFDRIITDPLSLPFHIELADAGSRSTRLLTTILFYVVGMPIFAGGLWILTATTVKRLHDRNKSGWWIVPFFVAPNLSDRVSDWLGNSQWVGLLMMAFAALGIWGFVETFFMRGTKGENRFGSDPLILTNAGLPTNSHWDQQSELEWAPHRPNQTQPK